MVTSKFELLVDKSICLLAWPVGLPSVEPPEMDMVVPVVARQFSLALPGPCFESFVGRFRVPSTKCLCCLKD